MLMWHPDGWIIELCSFLYGTVFFALQRLEDRPLRLILVRADDLMRPSGVRLILRLNLLTRRGFFASGPAFLTFRICVTVTSYDLRIPDTAHLPQVQDNLVSPLAQSVQ